MKSKETKNRKSDFNSNRPCYLSADGKFYCYEVYDSENDRIVTQMFEVGKDFSTEWALFLDETDHNMDMNDRYEDELRDPLFDAKVNSYMTDPDNEDAVDPWCMLVDKSSSTEDALFVETE